MRSKPITNKASSACKINMGLVQGQGDVQNSKGFVDYGKLVSDKMDKGGGKVASDAVKTTDEDTTDTKTPDPKTPG